MFVNVCYIYPLPLGNIVTVEPFSGNYIDNDDTEDGDDDQDDNNDDFE